MIIAQLRFLIFRRPALARKGIVIDATAYCDRQTHFEGRNHITAGAHIYRSRFGFASYVGARSQLARANVGRFSCIGPDVQTVVGAHPSTGFVSIHPAFFSTTRQSGFTFVDQDLYPELGTRQFDGGFLIDIGADVWIGQGARLMQGIKIGHGAIVATGSVVTKDVPPYTIVGGVPARILKQRFPDATIQRLLKTAWWQLEFAEIARLAPHFSNPEELLNILEKSGQKT